jgi:hypothetical protein
MTTYKISSEPTYYPTPGQAPGVGIRIYPSTRPPGPAPEPLPGLLHGAANQREPYGPRTGLLGKVIAWLQAQPEGGTYYEAAQALGEDPQTVKVVFQNSRGKWLEHTPLQRHVWITDKNGNRQRRKHYIWRPIKQ